jgi:hypothetical protein
VTSEWLTTTAADFRTVQDGLPSTHCGHSVASAARPGPCPKAVIPRAMTGHEDLVRYGGLDFAVAFERGLGG